MNQFSSSQNSLVEKIVSLGVFLFPVLILTVDYAASVIFVLFFILSLPVLFKALKHRDFSRDEKLLFYSCSLLLPVAMFTSWLGGYDDNAWNKMDGFLDILIAIPLYFLFKEKLKNTNTIWYGLLVAVIVCGLVAIYEKVYGSLYPGFGDRAKGTTHPILFADITLTMCFMLLLAATTLKKLNIKVIAVLGLVLLFGLIAVILSQSRGAWVIVPVFMLFLFWQVKSRVSLKAINIGVLTIVITSLVAYVIPETGLQKRIETTFTNIEKYDQGKNKGSSIGTRFEMWKTAWMIFKENPLAGVGWGNYKESAMEKVEQGLVNKSAASWNHPHNEILSVMANGGLLMLFAMVVFYTVPLLLFIRLLKLKNPEIKALALAGVVLIVGYIGYGLSEAILERSLPTKFIAFYLALLLAQAYRLKELANLEKNERNAKLSVTVIAYNEVDRLGDCLASVKDWADEIIVFDNGSTDGTIELAKQYTDKVFVTDWPGFGKQKQRALDKTQYEWILSIDADERLTPSLRAEIDRTLSDNPEEVAFRIPWAVTIYNKRLDFGRSGRAPLRLFRKQGAKFSEATVHEKVLLPEGKVGMLHERLLHYTHRNLNHAVRKFNDYAWLWGTERFEKGKRCTFVAPVFHGTWTFFVIYFLRLGVLDGFRGLIMAVHLSLYTFNKYAVLWTLEKQQNNNR